MGVSLHYKLTLKPDSVMALCAASRLILFFSAFLLWLLCDFSN